VDYIVSQGISRDRISGKGYGESQLLNRCADGVNCTEAEHAINRRTEMKVICPDNK
jgi:outer membrane protein OmpA-like peptidoglycan-associated protein